jgi:hypothetical protein
LDEIVIVFPVPGKTQVVVGHDKGIIKLKTGTGGPLITKPLQEYVKFDTVIPNIGLPWPVKEEYVSEEKP